MHLPAQGIALQCCCCLLSQTAHSARLPTLHPWITSTRSLHALFDLVYWSLLTGDPFLLCPADTNIISVKECVGKGEGGSIQGIGQE